MLQKIVFFIWLAFTFLFINIVNAQIEGLTYTIRNTLKVGVGGVKILLSNGVDGCYTKEDGSFEIINELVSDEYLIAIKSGFIPSITEVSKRSSKIEIELNSINSYSLSTPPFGRYLGMDSIFIQAKIFDEDSKPLSGVLVYLMDSPFFAFSDKQGFFQMKLFTEEILYNDLKEYYLAFTAPGYELEVISIKKRKLLDNIKKNALYIDLDNVILKKYIPPSQLGDLNERIELLESALFVDMSDSEKRQLQKRFDDISILIDDIDTLKYWVDTLKFPKKFETYNDSNILIEIDSLRDQASRMLTDIDSLLKHDTIADPEIKNIIDSIYHIKERFNEKHRSINDSIKVLNNLIESVSEGTKENMEKIFTVEKRVDNTIESFNRKVDAFEKTYLSRSRQDDKGIQLFFTILSMPGTEYPDSVNYHPWLDLFGINTYLGLKSLQDNGIYFDISYQRTSKAFNIGVNFRPPLDIIKNLKLDPGIGYSNALNYLDEKSRSGQLLLKASLAYRIYAPEDYPTSGINKALYNTYIYGMINYRLIFGKENPTDHNNKFMYAIPFFGFGIKYNFNNLDFPFVRKNK